MRRAAILCLALLAACGRPSLDDPNLSGRQLDLERYFDGRTTAHGQFQDRFGTVRRRFEVAIDGTWDGETLTLVEDFSYDDGTTERRVWTLRKTGPDRPGQTWEGTAPGVIGTATGEERGDAFNWRYTIDLPVPGEAPGTTRTLRVTFDDWMWLLPDGKLLNRAYMERFGVEIGEVVIFFER
ncbi:MAG: DUF3833 domain-containing protein [Hasllibacter sp.]